MQPHPPLWRDRQAAGLALAERWADIRGRDDTLLIGLPRGGVAVAAAMADGLALPLASWAVRKITTPAWPEVEIGAVAPGGVVLWGPPEHLGASVVSSAANWCASSRPNCCAGRGATATPIPAVWPDSIWWWWTTASPPA